MPKKYRIHPKPTPLGLDYIFKFKITRSENCINCGKCTRVCIYEAHKRGEDDPRRMAEPNTVVCRNCFRCIQECPRGALEKAVDDNYSSTGGIYWTPEIQLSLWKQAETGKVPVSGAGYRGPFTGSGFDAMWTDMSEIVRPTRDGIDGREYISTVVNLGRKLNHLFFNSTGYLDSRIPRTVDIPLPVIFDIPVIDLSYNIILPLIQAAAEIGTYIVLPASMIDNEIFESHDNVIPLFKLGELQKYNSLIKNARLISIDYDNTMLEDFQRIKAVVDELCSAVTIVRIPATTGIENVVAKLACGGAEVIHIVADYRGRAFDNPVEREARFLKDIIRAVHKRLVEERVRDEITLIASGGIAMAEHVAKAMLCGIDVTAIDIPLMIALGAKVYEKPDMNLVLPESLEKIAPQVLKQRIVNLMASWHSQILEVMGAMGIREVSRLRGEAGRAIFFEEIERDTFGNLFGIKNGK